MQTAHCVGRFVVFFKTATKTENQGQIWEPFETVNFMAETLLSCEFFSKWFYNFSFTNEKENNVLTQASQFAYVGILMKNDGMLFLQKKFLNGF